jgi:hypothetical protein
MVDAKRDGNPLVTFRCGYSQEAEAFSLADHSVSSRGLVGKAAISIPAIERLLK